MGEVLDRLREAKPLGFHQKIEDIAIFARRMIEPGHFLVVHEERRGFFRVERRKPFPFAPCPHQFDAVAHNLRYRKPGFDLIEKGRWKSHGRNSESKARIRRAVKAYHTYPREFTGGLAVICDEACHSQQYAPANRDAQAQDQDGLPAAAPRKDRRQASTLAEQRGRGKRPRDREWRPSRRRDFLPAPRATTCAPLQPRNNPASPAWFCGQGRRLLPSHGRR